MKALVEEKYPSSLESSVQSSVILSVTTISSLAIPDPQSGMATLWCDVATLYAEMETS